MSPSDFELSVEVLISDPSWGNFLSSSNVFCALGKRETGFCCAATSVVT